MIRKDLVIALWAGLPLAGCGVGTSSLVFTSASRAGVEASIDPPSLNIGVNRTEGLIAPTYEQGKTPPVVAGLRFADRGVFAPAVGSAFAAGDAARAMTELYRDETPTAPDPSLFDSSIELSAAPIAPGEPPLPGVGEVRPLVFGSETSIGLRMTWAGAAAPTPTGLRLGFGRSDFAWAPVTYRVETGPAGEARHFVRAPSLIATTDTGVNPSDPAGTNVEHLQYFATGSAATRLALQRDVRSAMLRRLDPASNELLQLAPEGPALRALEAWLVDPALDDAERLNRRQLLADWLRARSIELSPTTWLYSASESQRAEAARDLGAAR